MPLQVIPRGRRVLREALLAQPVLTATKLGSRVHESIDDDQEWPMARLSTIDQTPLRPNEADFARVQIDIYGEGATVSNVRDVEDIAAVLVSVLQDCDGDWPSGKLRAVSHTITIPSTGETGRARIIVDVEMQVSP
jgi:hypothetical protein